MDKAFLWVFDTLFSKLIPILKIHCLITEVVGIDYC